MTAYNLPTGANNISSMSSLGRYANSVTGNWFWPLVLISCGIILFMTLKLTTTPARAFATSGFICAILSILMWTVGFITFATTAIFMIIAVLAGGALYLEEKGYY